MSAPTLCCPSLECPRCGAGALDTSDAEVINDLLLRWQALDPEARRRLAVAILSRHAITATIPQASSRQLDSTLRSELEKLAARHTADSHSS